MACQNIQSFSTLPFDSEVLCDGGCGEPILESLWKAVVDSLDSIDIHLGVLEL